SKMSGCCRPLPTATKAPIGYSTTWNSVAIAREQSPVLLYPMAGSPAWNSLNLQKTTHDTMKQVIATNDAPAAIGPYSQAIRHGNLVFLSGQLPIDTTDGSVPEDIAAQTRQSLENMRHVL